MDTKHLVHPDLLPLLDAMPELQFSIEAMPAIRTAVNEMFAAKPALTIEGVTVKEAFVPNLKDGHQVRILIYTPENTAPNKPALFHTHGGGYVMGSPEMNDNRNKILCKELNAVIVSVDYRLGPECPFPLPIEDCYAALKWLYDNAATLGANNKNIAIYGESAGGGLAAALAIVARDRKEVPIVHQFLIYPMLDDRTCITEEPNLFTGEFIWTRENNFFGWTSLLGQKPGAKEISPYAAARVENIEGLPPAFITVGALDLFLEEDIHYAQRLLKAGISTELHVYAGAYHGFDAFVPESALTRQLENDFMQALKKALVK